MGFKMENIWVLAATTLWCRYKGAERLPPHPQPLSGGGKNNHFRANHTSSRTSHFIRKKQFISIDEISSQFSAGRRALRAFHHGLRRLAAATKTPTFSVLKHTFDQITHLVGNLIFSEKKYPPKRN